MRKIIHLWWENFRQNWQISLLGVNSDLYGKTFLAFFKIIFWQGATKLQLLVVFWGGRQHCNLHIQKNSSMEKTIQKIILFYPFSQNDRKLSGLLAIVLACLSKLHARSSYKLFEDLKTTKKLKIFYPLCSLKGIFPFFDEFFLGGFKICLQRIRRKILNEIFWYKKSVFYHIRTRSGDFRPLSGVFSAGLSELHPRCPEEHFEEKISLKVLKFFHRFWILPEDCWTLAKFFLQGCVWTAFYASITTFSENEVF